MTHYTIITVVWFDWLIKSREANGGWYDRMVISLMDVHCTMNCRM